MISKIEKIQLLKKLLDDSKNIKVESSSDAEFKTWKNLVERKFIKIFGKESPEFEQFSKLKFFYPARIYTSTSDYTLEHLRAFRNDFKILCSAINQYIEEIEESEIAILVENQDTSNQLVSKVFISHASLDLIVVEEVIDLLELIGLEPSQIFCTSFEGYGIDLGENFLDKIKEQLTSNMLVIFMLSENFYKSPVCLCEMGAAWVLTKNHIPILIPPMDYKDLRGVIPGTQGLKINDPMKLNSLKAKIESLFCIENKASMSTWERKRDKIVARIEKHLGV